MRAMIDYDHLQEGKIDADPNIRCDECGKPYPLDYWQRFKCGLGPTTEFVCEECAVIEQHQTEHHLLEHYDYE